MNPVLKKVARKLLPLHWELAGYRNRGWIDAIVNTPLPAPTKAAGDRLRVAFVTSWYGKGIVGGAESECFGLVHGLKDRGQIDVEVISTTLKEFSSDWNHPFHSPGKTEEDGIVVHRFNPTLPDRRSFHVLNGSKLMPGGTKDLKDAGNSSPVSKNAEAFYLQHMIHSPTMIEFLKKQYNNYDLFVFIPYMFGPTVLGGLLTREKAVVIPCLHDERYAFMQLYKHLMTAAKASIFHVPAELRLAQQIYSERLAKPFLLGEAVDTKVEPGNPERFREKFGIKERFILYAGRMIKGKNVDQLVDCFVNSPLRPELRLVLIGKGDLDYEEHMDIYELGFVDEQDKLDAYAAADALCQPSLNESFSIVMMEAWLQGTPCLVHADCAVTKDHIVASNGGLTFHDQASFDAALKNILASPDLLKEWGQNGRSYVLDNFAPDKIYRKFEDILYELGGKSKPT